MAYRMWLRPTVVAGRIYRTGGGRVEVISVETHLLNAITDDDATRAGYVDRQSLVDYLGAADETSGRQLFRVEFRLCLDPDPREELANTSNLTADDVRDITTRLDRYDQASNHGSWTRQTLRLIGANEAVRAPDLADHVGRETKPFKLDVRKLKNLGLTISLARGYRLSPRGRAYLQAVGLEPTSAEVISHD